MRFKLTLYTRQIQPQLTLNYQYPLSAAVYKIIERSDAAFSELLHNTGYGKGHKSFKLFTFSDILRKFDKEVTKIKKRLAPL
jgi:CRISPR-associated endoribonuclease Cas6